MANVLVAGAGGYDVFLPQSGGRRGVEPLCGVYGPACGPAIRERLEIPTRTVLEGLQPALDGFARGSGPTQVSASNRFRRVFDAAAKEAERLKDDYVSTEHFLLALADDSETGAAGQPRAARAAFSAISRMRARPGAGEHGACRPRQKAARGSLPSIPGGAPVPPHRLERRGPVPRQQNRVHHGAVRVWRGTVPLARECESQSRRRPARPWGRVPGEEGHPTLLPVEPPSTASCLQWAGPHSKKSL